MEAGDRVQTAYSLTASLRELEDNGFLAFGAREVQLLDGGIQAVPSSWPIAILRILRRDNDEMLRMTVDKTTDEKPNRVGGRIDLPPPTPPSKRVRTRRFRLD
jgi:hypothetical protein